MSSRTAVLARRLATLILVVLASTGVGLGAMSLGLLSVPWGADQETAGTVRFVAAVALLAGLLVLLVQQRSSRPATEGRGERGDDPTGSSFLAAAGLMTLLMLLVLFLPLADPPGGPDVPGRAAWGDADTPEPDLELPPPPEIPPPGPPPELVPPELSDEEPDDTPEEEEEAGAEPTPPTPAEVEAPPAQSDAGVLDGLAGLSLLFLLLLAAGASALTLWGWFGRRRHARPPAGSAAEGPPAGPFEETAEPAFDPETPRGRITLTYRRLLEALDEAGVPRDPWEAPYEHLHRAAHELELHGHAPRRLARLHVAAQFSPHPVTDEDVAEAEAALQESLAGVRQAPGRSRAGAVPAASGEGGR